MKILVVTPLESYDSFGDPDVLNGFVKEVKVYDASTPEKTALSWSKALKGFRILKEVLDYTGLGIVGQEPVAPKISLKDVDNSDKVAKLIKAYEEEVAEFQRLEAEEDTVLNILRVIEETPLEELDDSFDIASKVHPFTLEEFIKYMERIADKNIYSDSLNFYSYTELQ